MEHEPCDWKLWENAKGGTPMILVNFLKVEILSKPLGEALRDHIWLKSNVLWIVEIFLLST
jgi:hypothetical protein